MTEDYIVEIKGNEALLDKFIDSILQDTCKADKEYPHPYILPSGEKFLNNSVVEYFINKKPFIAEKAIQFCEKLRKLDESGIAGYNYTLELWIEEHVEKVYFNKETTWEDTLTLKPEIDISAVNQEYLTFMCYVAITLIKYGASFEVVVANEYFDMVKKLGSNEVDELKKHGSKKLPKTLTEYKDQNISCIANDVFATIKIKVKEENEESYRAILEFICKLLESDFPKSYSIEFSSKIKNTLPIKGLPKPGVHYLFANAVQYPALHALMVEYSNLALKKWEWYNNMQDENCAVPSTFAVFALGLEDPVYFDLVIKYMQTVDEEHQSIQEKFTPAFVEKSGINKQSFPVFISCILSMQEHKSFKIFAEQFSTIENLELLLACKRNFINYISEETKSEWSEEDLKEMPDYIWKYVLYSIWGPEEKYPALIKKSKADLKPLYQEILVIN
ncbi:hypothetical protein HDE68_004959 [Pedobacter cryoconitis]|uniref:Uncharacterized protein n=1 Tax=Pedobacter cryoconitis TaxID=188932 RepID=A0A7W9E1E4_9SPHI|nr:DUF6138 family protein [Pedobacter cryoconitis]MBB5639021.1 hypothetical protein [Pedobacter cryoconitis]